MLRRKNQVTDIGFGRIYITMGDQDWTDVAPDELDSTTKSDTSTESKVTSFCFCLPKKGPKKKEKRVKRNVCTSTCVCAYVRACARACVPG